ncbi:MAG TPA: hypothetical protein VK046_02815, partial [Actinomycetaceae bacterium]|nr:hypothetical protein [Actinomycetaceae bacterium]
MGEGTQRPVGERRRRREAARAAERAAEQSGQPLTRRELRRREAEEAARLEAIATGELDVGAVQRDAARSSAEETPPDGAPAVARAEPTGHPVSPSATSASAASASPASGSAATSASATSAAAAATRPPSRRSLRERAEAASRSTEAPQERTATGRRPVVRTPSTAQGIRVIDATGQLTGIQPVARPDAPSAAGSDYFSIELDGPAQTARAAIDVSPEQRSA